MGNFANTSDFARQAFRELGEKLEAQREWDAFVKKGLVDAEKGRSVFEVMDEIAELRGYKKMS